MRVFVAGATGALGRQLVPELVAAGHEVVGITRTAAKQEALDAMGAQAVVADALDPDAVARVVAEAEPEVIDKRRGGILFPHESQPDYLDFAYFAFVIGMICQVSDVSITSRPIRRLALLHGFLSFAFNTVILALSVNLISGLL